MPAFMACAMPKSLPTVAPVPAPTQPSGTAIGGGCRGGGFAHGGVGVHVRLADAEIEEDGAGHDRDVLAAEGVAHFTSGQVAAHTGGGFQAEGAAAGQQDAVDLIGDVAGAEGVDLLRAAGASADIDAADGALLAQNGSAAGDGAEIGDVPDANSGNIGKSFHGCAFSVLW